MMIGWTNRSGACPGGGPWRVRTQGLAIGAPWVPLIDASGSTIALVSSTSTQSQPTTTYTYDPSGNPTENPAGNTWPFLYQGREKEPSDPGPLYYSGGGQFYSPQLVRSLSEQGQTSSNGSGGGPAGRAISPPSGSSGGLSPQSVYNDTQQALQVGTDIYAGAWVLGLALGNPEVAIALAPPLAIIGGAVDFVVNFFEDIFGGGSSSETPRQLLSRRHPLYPKIIGVSEDLIPTEGSPVLDLPSQQLGFAPAGPPGNIKPLEEVSGEVVLAADKVVPYDKNKPEYYQRPDHLGEPMGKGKVYNLNKCRRRPFFPPAAGIITDIGPVVITISALCAMFDEHFLTGPRPQVCGPEPQN